MRPARFEETIVYVGEVEHPVYGLVHTLGYQNSVVNLATGPNAMILHIPAGVAMTQDNFIVTENCPRILRDMVDALKPPVVPLGEPVYRTAIGAKSSPVHVFDHDIYTVVLSEDASLIPEALSRVPVEKRPAINQPLFDFYADEFPKWSVALCCFDNKQASQAAPMFMHYKPMDDGSMHWPSLDCHTGDVPDVNAMVAVDHWIIAGSHRMDPDGGVAVRYSGDCDPDVRAFLPNHVIGRHFKTMLHNGDFVIDPEDVAAGLANKIRRLPAPSSVAVSG